jgi:acetyl-CoA carboxylase carboxyl transferase subunit alpha
MGLTAGEIVKLARHQERLTSLDYFEKIFTDFQANDSG